MASIINFMASVKKLKKGIHNICGELFSECMFCRFYIPNVNPEKADVLITNILKTQNEFIKRSNRVGGKDNKKVVKTYYAKLRKDFLQQIEGYIGEIQSLNA